MAVDGALSRKERERLTRRQDFFRIFAAEKDNLCGKFGYRWRERLLEKHGELVKLVAQAIESGVQKGTIRKVDPLRIAQVFHSLIHSFVFYRLYSEEKRSLEEEKKTIVAVLFDGIGKR
ncbi:MAG: TetR/AcrR family transcriptional regulator C-terminal domain-containing protein [bacterium]